MKTIAAVIALAASLLFALPSSAQNQPRDDENAVHLLSAGGQWRKHYTFIPVMISRQALAARALDPDSIEQRLNLGRFNRERISAAKLDLHTPPPPDNWATPDFDDREWLATPGGDFVPLRTIEPTPDNYSAMLSADPFIEQIGFIAMRGKFRVNDPAAVRGLTFELEYRGGFVAYLNGSEIARGHLPAGAVDPSTAAEDYPLSAYLNAEGEASYTAFSNEQEPLDPTEQRWRDRVRSSGAIRIDPALLRAGVNVLAIQLHRSDYPVEVREFGHSFAPIGVHRVLLAADAAPDNAVTSLAPPAGLTAWNAELWSEVTTADFVHPAEPLRPIRIEAARNGIFSGMAMVGSTGTISDIRAEASPLRNQAGGVIAADQIIVRYGAINPARADAWLRWDSGLQPFRFDAMLDAPPGSIEPSASAPFEEWTPVIRAHNDLPSEPIPYAALPVVISVNAPRDAAPGLYTGSVAISARGAEDIIVAVEMRLSEWTIPDRKDYESVAFISQNYSGIAGRYQVEPWSEEHWRLIERSLERMAEIGNAGLFFEIVTRLPESPEEVIQTTVREDGALEHDFSRLERYLDLFLKHHDPERVKITVLNVYPRRMDLNAPHLAAINAVQGESVIIPIPEYGTPECEEMLAPAIRGIRDVVAERGLEGTLMFGTPFDAAPDPKIVAMFRNILPEVPWYRVSHIDMKSFPYDERDPGLTAPVGSTSQIPRGGGTMLVQRGRRQTPAPFWQQDPDYMRLKWNRGGSAWFMPGFPEPWRFRGFHENAVLRGYRGVGNVCADAFGEFQTSYHGILNVRSIRNPGAPGLHVVTSDILAAGPDGPVHSLRSLNMLEGVQETEARIAVWRALTGGAAGDDLARRAEALLEERTQAMRTWDTHVDSTFWGGFIRRWTEFGAMSWLDKNRRLFDLAAEMEQAQ